MAEPTSALTLRDLVIRVAEYLGIAYYGADGSEEAQVPENSHDLELCKRLVNDGIRMFIQDNAKWFWTRRLYTLTVDGTGLLATSVAADPGRYAMPQDFGGDAYGRWTFGDSQNVWPEVVTVPEHVIRQWRSVGTSQSGIPRYAAFRRIPASDMGVLEGRNRWEVIFYPDPGQEYTLLYPYRHSFTALSDLDEDRPPAGYEHDETIAAATLAKAELDRDDTEGARYKYYQRCLQNSMSIDMQSAPNTVGPNLDRGGLPLLNNRRQLGYSRPVSPVNYQT